MVRFFKLMLMTAAFLMVFCSCKDSKVKEYTTECYGLNGDVKEVKTSAYTAKMNFDEIEKDERVKYDSDMPLRLYYLFKYVESGSVNVRQFDEKGKITVESEYAYDLDMVGKSVYEWNDNLLKMINYYDENGRNAYFENLYDGDVNIGFVYEREFQYIDKFYQKVLYKRDNDGEIVEMCDYTEDGILRFKQILEVVDGKTLNGSVYNTDGSLECKYEYEYKDEKVSMFRQITGDEVWTVNYDDGLIISSNGGNKYYPDLEFSYNEWRDPVTMKRDNDEYTFEYEYDKCHNWTKRITYKGIKPMFIEERVIEYY